MKYFRDYTEHLTPVQSVPPVTPVTPVIQDASLENTIEKDVYNNSVYMTNIQRSIISKTDDIIRKTNKKLEYQLKTL